MNKFILAVVVAMILGGWWYASKSDTPAPENTTETETTMGSVSTLEDGVYTLNTTESNVAWTGRKTLIKDYYDHGTIAFSSGSVVVTDGALVAGSFVVDINSIAVSSTGKGMGTDMLTNHLKSADFFDAATHPTATVGLVSVDADGTVTADVTIKGITQRVTFPATIAQDGTTITGTADLTIDRTLWDIRFGSTKFFGDLGDNTVGDEVALTLTLVAQK